MSKLNKTAPFIEDEHLQFVITAGDQTIKPFIEVHMFIKNNQSMTRRDFFESSNEIRDYLTDLGVNFGLLMFADGTYVFTQDKIKLDAIQVKLSTGINYHGLVSNPKNDLDRLNKFLGR